jgi:DNA-binding LytR/AlgR family response regulator
MGHMTDNCCTATFIIKGRRMFKNTPFESIAKTMSENAPKFNPAAMQEALKPAQENLKAWADLAQNQAKEAQAALLETVESIQGAKDPQAAFEMLKASAEAGMAMFAKNLKEATSLSVGQFHDTVDAIEKAHPAPEAFAVVAKNLKAAAVTAENSLDSALEKGASLAASVAPGTKAKKAR